MRKLHKDLAIAADMKKKGFEWIGHGARIDKGRTGKKIFESKPDGSRRPTVRWMEDVEKDLREMKVKRRRQEEVDRLEWASVIEGAKGVRGQDSQGGGK